MSFLRRTSGRSLLALVAVLLAALAAVGTVAALALGGGATPPPPKPLAQAIHDAAGAPDVTGVSARVTFTNHLFDALPTGEGSQPLLKGGSGRLWATKGMLRVELQGDSGDVQIVVADGKGYVYDGGTSDTVYRFSLPSHSGGAPDKQSGQDNGTPTLAQIQSKIDKASKHVTIAGPQPTSVANQPAYSVRITPKQSGGLLGAAELAWDAVRGVPLRFALYARGSSTPALELEATDVTYGPIAPSVFAIQPPASAHTVDLTGGGRSDAGTTRDHAGGHTRKADKPPAWLNDPASLAGRARGDVSALGSGGGLIVYGEGADAIVVAEHRADAKKPAAPQPQQGPQGDRQQLTLPTVSINGAKATELSTPLGSVVTFDRDGISYTVAGFQPAAVIESAARAL